MFVRSLHPRRLLRSLYGTGPFIDYCAERHIPFDQTTDGAMTEEHARAWDAALATLAAVATARPRPGRARVRRRRCRRRGRTGFGSGPRTYHGDSRRHVRTRLETPGRRRGRVRHLRRPVEIVRGGKVVRGLFT